MDHEELIDAVAARVRERLGGVPTALLLGERPGAELGWRYVAQPPYDAVMIGSMTPYELLCFPDERCTEALLLGKPVFLWEDGLALHRYARTANRALWSRLLSAQRQLRQLGVQFLGAKNAPVLTAEEVRRRLRTGQSISGRLTPLARDILEGRQP